MMEKRYKVRISRLLTKDNRNYVNVSFGNPGIQDGFYSFEVMEDKLYIYPNTYNGWSVTNNRTSVSQNAEALAEFMGEYHVVHLEPETEFYYVVKTEKKPLGNERKNVRKKAKVVGHEGEIMYENAEEIEAPIEKPIKKPTEKNKPSFEDKLFDCLQTSIKSGDNATAGKLLELIIETRGSK